MTIKAVVFDIGGVLEKVEPVDAWLARMADRLGCIARPSTSASGGSTRVS